MIERRSKYSRLTLNERKIIEYEIKTNYKSTSFIAKLLNRNISSIKDEIRKNGGREKYNARIAHNNAQRKTRLDNDEIIIDQKPILTLEILAMKIEGLEEQIKLIHEILEGIKNGKN